MRARPHACEADDSAEVAALTRLRPGTSWATVSDNVKRLVQAWEAEGTIAGSRIATRKDAIRCAVGLALRAAACNRRSPRRG